MNAILTLSHCKSRLVEAMMALCFVFACVAKAAETGDTVAEPLSPESAAISSGSELSTPLKEPADLWERMKNGFSLPPPENEEQVHAFENWYADHPSTVKTLVERSKRYLYFIVDEVEKRGIPAEMALLPMIESGFNPVAHSAFQAAGLWQLLPGTGRNFGLKSDPGYDGRKDIVAGTDAALKYLVYLHGMFGDWELALAAYNSGEGTVTRALHRASGRQQMNSLLPPQTREFYSKLIAIRNIFSDPGKFEIELDPIHNHPYFTQVEAKQDLNIRLAARLAEIPVEEFVALNPGATKSVWKSGNSRSLLLPADKAIVFAANLENSEDHLPDEATQANDEQPNEESATDEKRAPAAVAHHSAKRVAARKEAHRHHTYVVKKGDSLDLIARRHKVAVHDIRKWNHLPVGEHLMPGEKISLNLPAKKR